MNYKEKYLKYKTKYNNLKNKDLKSGDIVKYKNTNENVTILQVHYDDIEPYYTIKMKDGTEKQTIKNNLIKS